MKLQGKVPVSSIVVLRSWIQEKIHNKSF